MFIENGLNSNLDSKLLKTERKSNRNNTNSSSFKYSKGNTEDPKSNNNLSGRDKTLML